MLEEKKILEHVTSIRKTNKKIVFTNGCFDLLHKGHRDLIKQSFSFGDILIVGLNSDESVKRLKGEDRPLQNEVERKNALLNTGYVNKVYIFDDDTPEVKIEVLILKATTIDGKKIAKDTIVEIEEKEANKLIDAGNAKLVSE